MSVSLPYLLLWSPVIAFHPTMTQELAMGGAAVVMLAGVWLCWSAPNYRMSIEEGVKDGKITEDDANRKIRRNIWMGPCVTALGVGLLALAVTR